MRARVCVRVCLFVCVYVCVRSAVGPKIDTLHLIRSAISVEKLHLAVRGSGLSISVCGGVGGLLLWYNFKILERA